MIPFGTHTATLYHRQRTGEGRNAHEVWTRHLLKGCSWRERATSYAATATSEVVRTAETVCRIPAGQQQPFTGDILVKGSCAEEIATASDAARLIDRYGHIGAFRVTDVSDNTGAHLAHYAARGS